MPPVRTWNDINTILDSIDWSEFFKTIDENNQFQALGRSLKLFRQVDFMFTWRNEFDRYQFSHNLRWKISIQSFYDINSVIIY